MQPPENTKVVLTKGHHSIHVNRPPLGLPEGTSYRVLALGVSSLGLVLLLAIGKLDVGATLPLSVAGIWCLLGVWIITELLLVAATREELQIGCTYYGVWRHRGAASVSKHPGDPAPNRILGRTCEIDSVELVPTREEQDVFGSTQTIAGFIVVEEGENSVKFGVGLSMAELEWLHSEIMDTLNALKHSPSQKGPIPIQYMKMDEIV